MYEKETNYIFLEDENPTGDLAFVFGTGYSLKQSVEEAVSLYKKGAVKKVLFTGGINDTLYINEAETSLKYAIELGISKSDILIENRATNTLENVLFSIPIIDGAIGIKNIKTVVAVVKNFHSRRAIMTLKKNLPQYISFKVHSYVPTRYNFTKDNWHETAAGRESVFGEIEKIKIYLAKGHLEEL